MREDLDTKSSKSAPPKRVLPKALRTVRLTRMQIDYVEELARDNKPNLWNWRKYIKGIAVGVGYSPQGIDKLRDNDLVWFAARCLVNGLPVNIEEIPIEQQIGGQPDADRTREEGQPLSSLRQEKFCQEIIADPVMNARKAGKRAGYGNNGDYGWKLLQMPKIKQRIRELNKERMERLQANQDEVIQNLVRLSRVNMADYISRFDGQSIQFEDSNEITRDEMYGIKRVKQQIRGVGRNAIETFSLTLEDKFRANALLAKHLGLLDETVSFDPSEFAVQLRQLSKEAASKIPGGEV